MSRQKHLIDTIAPRNGLFIFFWSLLLGVLGGKGITYPNIFLLQMCLETMQPKFKTVFPLQAKYSCSGPRIRPLLMDTD